MYDLWGCSGTGIQYSRLALVGCIPAFEKLAFLFNPLVKVLATTLCLHHAVLNQPPFNGWHHRWAASGGPTPISAQQQGRSPEDRDRKEHQKQESRNERLWQNKYLKPGQRLCYKILFKQQNLYMDACCSTAQWFVIVGVTHMQNSAGAH